MPMGSLVPGWDSPRKDHERNRSLTKEEIENYWRINRDEQEEHMEAVAEASSKFSTDDTLISKSKDSGDEKVAATHPQDVQLAEDVDTLRKKKAGWWTRSNWAFLNEPPLDETEGPAYKYDAQYHVASRKPDAVPDGVATSS